MSNGNESEMQLARSWPHDFLMLNSFYVPVPFPLVATAWVVHIESIERVQNPDLFLRTCFTFIWDLLPELNTPNATF